MKRSEVIAELEGMLEESLRNQRSPYGNLEELESAIAVLEEAIRYLEESEKLGVDS